MFLNTLSPKKNSTAKKRRLGRGIGSGLGKTCGRGHKGQHARSGGYKKVGFEGGQMPLQRRLPKVGFKSTRKKYSYEVNLNEINSLDYILIDIDTLKSENIVPNSCKKVKVIDSGRISNSVTLKGLFITKGASKKIELAGGRVEV